MATTIREASPCSKSTLLNSVKKLALKLMKNWQIISSLKVLFILPRLSSHCATARVKLAKHRIEPQDQLTFCLVKRKKVTLFLKVSVVDKLRTLCVMFAPILPNFSTGDFFKSSLDIGIQGKIIYTDIPTCEFHSKSNNRRLHFPFKPYCVSLHCCFREKSSVYCF